MKGRFFSLLLGLLIAAHYPAYAGSTVSEAKLQTPDPNYVVLYVETVDQDAIDAFIAEMQSYSNKVVDISYNYETHEFTIYYTDLMRNDTIYQILLTYFTDFREVGASYNK